MDVSKELLPGENKLTVIAKNDQIPNARWYTGSGIYRPVSLWTSEKTHIAVEGIRISSPECAEDVSKVIVETPLIHSHSEIAYVRLETELIDQDGAVICRESTPVTLFPGENPVIAQRLYPRNVKLWNVWQPYLYTVRVALTDEKPIKTMEAYMSHKNGTAGEHHTLDMAEAQPPENIIRWTWRKPNLASGISRRTRFTAFASMGKRCFFEVRVSMPTWAS